jgi:hypothetical protein
LLVYDKVCSIVPAGALYTPSDLIRRHLEKMPDTFEKLAPEPLDIVQEYFVIHALREAFDRIAAQPKVAEMQTNRLHFRSAIDTADELEISGIVKLHEFKIAYSVHQMLEESGLIYGRSKEGFAHVNKDAAWLIVSFLAQRMSNRLAMRTITDGEPFYYLSAACDVIEAGDPVDSRGLLASSVLSFHIPGNIDAIGDTEFSELRKRYEALRETFPLYLRDLGDLIQIDDVRHVPELLNRIKEVVNSIDRDVSRIKKSQKGASIVKWLPVGIGSAVTLGSAFLSQDPSLKYVTAAATVALQILTKFVDNKPLPGRLEGTQSLLLSAQKDILNKQDMAASLSIAPHY